MVLRYLLEKEFLLIRRNPVFIGTMLVFTLAVLLLFPWVINFEIKDVTVSIVNTDQSEMAQRLINKIEHNPHFTVTDVYPTYEDARADIESSRSVIILDLPSDFGETMSGSDRTAQVYLMANAVDGQQGAIASSYVQALIMDYAEELRAENLGVTSADMAPVEIVPHYSFNPSLNYKYFMLPAFLAMLLTMFCGIFPALSIVFEKETGTLNQINVTPVNSSTFILSKVIFYWIIGSLIFFLSLLVIYFVYGLPVEGSIGLLYLCSLAFIIAMSFFGVTISNITETQQQAMFVVIFFILILFLVSGLFSPVVAMPKWAQAIAYSNPLTYYIRVTRMIYLKGSGFMDVLSSFAVLLIFVLLFGTTAIVTHRKRH